MEGDGRGKRQRPEDGAVPGGPAEQDGEEEQVEKFFALLRSVRELREQLRRAGDEGGVERKRTKTEGSAAWTPTFQWEDFAGVAGLVRGPAPDSSGTSEVGEQGGTEKKEEGTSLELKLAL